MEIHSQWDFYYKVKDLLRANFGIKFGIKYQVNGKTLCMIVSKSDVVLIGRIINYLNSSLKIKERSEDKLNANHGATDGTIVINISMFSQASISLIDALHDRLKPNQKKQNMKKLKDENLADNSGQVESLDFKTPHCSKYEFAKYLKSVLRFEGLDTKAFSIKKEGDNLKLCSKDPYVTRTAEEAINYYFGKQVANVYVGNDDHCISFLEANEQSAQAKRFSFCPAPEEKADMQDIERRLNRVFSSKKYVIQKTKDGFDVNFQAKGLVELRFALLEMGWKIKDKDGGFSITVTRPAKILKDLIPNTKPAHKPVQKTESTEQSHYPVLTSVSSDSKESFKTKEEAFNKLCELIESEDFNLLDDLLKERVLQKKEDHLKSIRREEVTAYAKNLLAILD